MMFKKILNMFRKDTEYTVTLYLSGIHPYREEPYYHFWSDFIDVTVTAKTLEEAYRKATRSVTMRLTTWPDGSNAKCWAAVPVRNSEELEREKKKIQNITVDVIRTDEHTKYVTADGYLHREDGPAWIDHTEGVQYWCQRGCYHREDGPAVVYDDGVVAWFWKGVSVRFVEWLKYAPLNNSEKMYMMLKYGE